MTSENPDRIRLTVQEALDISRKAIVGIGHTPDEARIIADHMVDAAVCGYEYLGLSKILRMADHYRPQRGEISLTRISPVSSRIEAAHNVGMLVMPRAVDEVVRLVGEHGIGIVGVSNAWMSGRSAYYCEKLAERGIISIHTASGSPLVAPPNATQKVLGTNPLAFGFPTDSDPLVIDIGTSAIAASDLELHHRLGTDLPPGAAIDAHGDPTNDPSAAVAGALLSFGGHKGFALSLAVHAMGALCAPPEASGLVEGHVFIGLSPDVLLPSETYRAVLTEQLEIVRHTPARQGVSEIRIPGQRAQMERRRSLEMGIVVDRDVLDAVVALGQR